MTQDGPLFDVLFNSQVYRLRADSQVGCILGGILGDLLEIRNEMAPTADC
jgi:hypothetical protein